MADKVPIRAVFNDAGTATGLSEFQTGDTIGLHMVVLVLLYH